MSDKPESAAGISSPPLAGSALLRRLRQHEAMMGPHQKDRETGRLYVAATAEIARLIDLCTSVHDRLLRGDADTVLLSRLAEGWQGPNNGVMGAAEPRTMDGLVGNLNGGKR